MQRFALATLVFHSLLAATHAQTVTQPDVAKAKPAAKEASDSLYLRILRNDDDDPIAMQTSVVSFTKRNAVAGNDSNVGADVVVDLIGAVHVADKPYFQRLNQLFTKYDAVLYELVAPEENNVPVGGTSQHPVGQMQQGMKSMLELAYQLEEVDYRKSNFVHADMSPAEFSRVMGERNENWFAMMMKMMGSAMALQGAEGRGGDADILFAFFADNRALRLKRVMSTQFGNLESTMSVLEGENGSTIIGERNNKALEVLRRELANGKKRVAVFYGAGHLPDMEEKLIEQFGLQPDKKSVQWLTAWDMQD